MTSPRIAALVAAAVDGDEAGLRRAIDELTEPGWPVTIVGSLVPWLADPRPAVVQAVGLAAEALLDVAPLRSAWALDRAVRARHVPELPPERLADLGALPRGRAGALALATMQRRGWTRADAIERFGAATDRRALWLRLVRLNDPVPEIATAVATVLLEHLPHDPVAAWVAVLPLVDSLATTVRAGTFGVAEAVAARLAAGGRATRAALHAACADRDEDLRIAVVDRLARGWPSEPDTRDVLVTGLADRSPRVRAATARLAIDGTLPTEVARALVPQLERNRSPAIRRLALHWRRRAGDVEALLAACFDRNAAVRHYARRYHRRAGAHADYRALALARLRADDPGVLVGALATLSDVGRAEDRSAVAELASHPVARVAAEARRTLARLGDGAG